MSLLALSQTATVALLSAFWLAGFLLIWQLMRSRLMMLEEKLHGFGLQIDHFRRAHEDRAGAVTPDPGREGRAAIAAEVARLSDAVDSVREAQAEARVAHARAVELIERLAADLEQGRAERLVDRIKLRFSARGFNDIRVLGDLSSAGDPTRDGPLRVPLEGMKGGVTYKGYVVIDGGQVVDEKLTSSHEAFP